MTKHYLLSLSLLVHSYVMASVAPMGSYVAAMIRIQYKDDCRYIEVLATLYMQSFSSLQCSQDETEDV